MPTVYHFHSGLTPENSIVSVTTHDKTEKGGPLGGPDSGPTSPHHFFLSVLFTCYMPPSELRREAATIGVPAAPGTHLGRTHTAGGLVGPESYVAPLGSLEGQNMATGRSPDGILFFPA
eukprot:726094-Pyramimonas_sp.AAC.1